MNHTISPDAISSVEYRRKVAKNLYEIYISEKKSNIHAAESRFMNSVRLHMLYANFSWFNDSMAIKMAMAYQDQTGKSQAYDCIFSTFSIEKAFAAFLFEQECTLHDMNIAILIFTNISTCIQ